MGQHESFLATSDFLLRHVSYNTESLCLETCQHINTLSQQQHNIQGKNIKNI